MLLAVSQKPCVKIYVWQNQNILVSSYLIAATRTVYDGDLEDSSCSH